MSDFAGDEPMRDARRAVKVRQVLLHGASPHRWARRGAAINLPRFVGGCFLTPNPYLASLYCRDWKARPDKRDFIQRTVDEVFALGDPEELLGLGLLVETEDGGYRRGAAASADHILAHWSDFEISHYLVRPSSHTLHDYPAGATVYPMQLRTRNVRFIDCEGNHFDDLPGRLIDAGEQRVSTDDVVKALRGQQDAVWFESLTDPVHATIDTPTDVVFVYDPRHMEFALTNESPADLCVNQVLSQAEWP